MNPTAKVLLIVCGVLVGLPILACGGCLMLSVAMNASITPVQREAMQAESDARAKVRREESDKLEAERKHLEDVSAKRPQPNMTNYLRLETGMKYSEVVTIIGEPTEELSRNSIGGTETVLYMWRASAFGANMNAMFQNGRLVQKAQLGLPQGIASEAPPEVIPQGVYITGMNLEPIEKFLKSKGFFASSDTSKSQDVWKFDSTTPILSVVVRGDSPNKISSVRCIAADQKTLQENLAFFRDMATIPYKNSDRVRAVKWVEDNYETNATTTIGEAQFHGFLTGPMWILDIEPKK